MSNKGPKDFVYHFAAPVEEVIVPTGMMLEVIKRTAAVHPGNSIWYGESRIGKTTTAKLMVQKIAEAYDSQNPYAYRALHYEAGKVEEWTGNEMKKGIKSLYCATLGRIDEGIYRHDPAESLAMQLVHGLRRKNIQIVLIDEAGTLSVEAIRGMVLVGNVAKNEEYPLSLVFIGMDDLPTKVQHLPQVDKRFVEWCYFEAYSLKDIARLLAQLHPHFKQLDLKNPKHYAQIECVYEMFGGFLGLIMPFLRKLDRYQRDEPEEITTTYLRSIHLRTLEDKKQSVKGSLNNYRGRPLKDSRSGYTPRIKQDKEGMKSDAKKTKGRTPRERERTV
jgi:hypothetical protein